VGKSTLFNIFTESRKAVVRDQPGVTRDIQKGEVESWGKHFEILDTGGLTEDSEGFSPLIREQVLQILSSVEIFLVVMDGRAGVCPEDKDILRLVQSTGKPFLVIVNKLDSEKNRDVNLAEFYELGGEVLGAAFERRAGLSEILEWLLPQVRDVEPSSVQAITIAIVGKPNVGKSSLVNHLLGEKRMLVSEVAGTTVDAVDSYLEIDGKGYVLVDTAGLRKLGKRRQEDVEMIASFKSRDAISRSDIVLLLVDGTQGPSVQDAKIVEEILSQHRGVILVANKSDIAKEQVERYRETFRQQVSEVFHFFKDIPICFISAKTGSGVHDLFVEIQEVWDKLHYRIRTRDLNDFFVKVIRQAPAPVWGTKNVKFYYLTQTHQVPPSFIAYANHPDGVDGAYRRFLVKRMKENWSLQGIPLRIFVMKSNR
jgi:GTP-binding protein